MELNDFVEFKKLKNSKFAIHFQIEQKEFNAFNKTFITDKYLDVTQWEEIMRKLIQIAQRKQKSQTRSDEKESEKEDQFEVDGLYCVKWKFLPKEESYIDFQKLFFTYEFNWYLQVKITKLSLVKETTNKESDKTNDIPQYSQKTVIDEYDPLEEDPYMSFTHASNRSAVTPQEYEPSPPTPEAPKTHYTPSKKRSVQLQISPQYTPRSTSHNYTNLLNKYTPSKIENNVNDREEHFVWDDSDDKTHNSKPEKDEAILSPEKTVQKNGSRSRKRSQQLLTKESVKKATENAKKKRQPSKKTKIDEPQQTINCWLKTGHISETPSKVTQRNKLKCDKKKQQSSSVHQRQEVNLDKEKLQKMNDYVERMKQDIAKADERRLELKDYEILNCNDLSDDDLKRLVKEFAPNIKKHLSNQYFSSSRNKEYDPVIFTTSNVLTMEQCEYVLQQIEQQRALEDRGQNEDILTDKILPEFIIHVFCTKFSMSRENALKRLATQEECQILFLNETSL